MIYKTSELTGALLDSAVAKAEGMIFKVVDQKVWGDGSGITIVSGSPACQVGHDYFEPSSSWAQGGPIIEREGIELWKWTGDDGTYWCAHVGGRRVDTADKESLGETPLVAAMRAIVTAKLGAEVDL